MEKRALLAIVLSVVVFLAWQALFPPPTPPPPSQAPGTAPGQAPSQDPIPTPGTPTPPPGGEASPVPGRPARPLAAAGRTVQVRTPLYEATFGGDGAATGWALRYRGPKPLVLGSGIGPMALAVTRPGQPPEIVSLAADTDRLELTEAGQRGTVTFGGTAGGGLRVEKRLTFEASSYRVTVELRAEGGDADAPPGTAVLYWTSPVALPGQKPEEPWHTFGETPDRRQLVGRILVARNGSPEVLEPPAPALKDPKESPAGPELKNGHPVETAVLPDPRRWIALENDYFIAAFIPPAGARVLRGRDRDLALVGVVFPDVAAGPGRAWEGKTDLYVGPKEWDRLTALNVGLEQAQARNYGCFPLPCDYGGPMPMEWVCVPLLWLMNFIAARMGGNYGVAIILLTVLVKILFFPLTQKSMTSMKQMQALQPQLNALRSKFKSDPQRFQREQMELFRKHRVNPMGGCLPMVVQIPIFYALYLTLQYSVELQGAHFLLWITDLSRKDPYYVLPILMGASMLGQQLMTPTVGDPRQARVMLIMPVIFTFMFLEFPTGLVLYWLVNNLLSMGQQYLIDRAAKRPKPPAAVETKPPKEKEAHKA
jgi:YidC/Oxa1 family membrane protein insertase